MSLTKFLQTLDLKTAATIDLPSSSKSAIILYASKMFNRLFLKEVKSERVETEIQSDDSYENEQVLDLHIRDRDRLATAINAAFKNKKTETKTSVNQKINLQKELKI